ncbi:MAG: glycosyl hydrolase family 28-related protein [Puniceicoccales bacterium]
MFSALRIGAFVVLYSVWAISAQCVPNNYDAFESSTTHASATIDFGDQAISVSTGAPYVFRRAFSTQDSLSPDSGYSGPTFYGGYQFSSSTIDAGFNREEVRDDFWPSNTDQIFLQAYNSSGWSGSTLSLHGCFLFLHEDYQNALAPIGAELDEISVSWGSYGHAASGGSPFDAKGRLLIQRGNKYYVSQTTFSLITSGAYTLDGTSLENEEWALYDPANNLNFNQGSAEFESNDSNGVPIIQGVTGLGVYFEDDDWSGATSATPFGFGLCGLSAADDSWCHELYDSDWSPIEYSWFNYNNQIMQDFSYAGYRNGEQELPEEPYAGPLVDVIEDHNAVNDGFTDCTAAIQSAIDSLGSGGGVVYLPEGTYLVSPQTNANYCLRIKKSNIILRGAGPDKTKIVTNASDMKGKRVIYAFSNKTIGNEDVARWNVVGGEDKVLLSDDVMNPSKVIPVVDASKFAAGDRIIIRMDPTEDWVEGHGEESNWGGSNLSKIGEIMYLRTVESVNNFTNKITVNIPIRYYLKERDAPYVYKKKFLIEGVGIEDLSIGNKQRTGSGWDTNDYDVGGTNASKVHGSYAIEMLGVVNGWIRNVNSFNMDSTGVSGGEVNPHIGSNGIRLKECSAITVRDCHFQRPQYGGGGGNGYMFRLDNSNECLLYKCTAEYSRHGYSITGMASSGNVLLECTDIDTGHQIGKLTSANYAYGDNKTTGKGSDHHMWFSHSNLFDNCTAINSWFEARDRWYPDLDGSPNHGVTSAHTVFWNNECQSNSFGNYGIWSQQFGYGYVIGTRGAQPNVETERDIPQAWYDDPEYDGLEPLMDARAAIFNPEDVVAGEGQGDTLYPYSLYWDQLRRRLAGNP